MLISPIKVDLSNISYSGQAKEAIEASKAAKAKMIGNGVLNAATDAAKSAPKVATPPLSREAVIKIGEQAMADTFESVNKSTSEKIIEEYSKNKGSKVSEFLGKAGSFVKKHKVGVAIAGALALAGTAAALIAKHNANKSGSVEEN